MRKKSTYDSQVEAAKITAKGTIIAALIALLASIGGTFLGSILESNKEQDRINQIFYEMFKENENDIELKDIKEKYANLQSDNEKLRHTESELRDKIINLNNEKTNLNESISIQSEKIERLEMENNKLRDDLSFYQMSGNNDVLNDKNEYVNLLSICEPYEKTPHVYIIESYIKMCGKTYSNGLNMACDGYYALFNLEGKYNSMKFEVGHIDGTVMSYGEIHIYVDNLKSDPVVIPVNPEGEVESYEINLDGANQLKIATVANTTSIGVGIVNIEVK